MQGIASGSVWTACCWGGNVAHCQCVVVVVYMTASVGEFSLSHARASGVAVSTTACRLWASQHQARQEECVGYRAGFAVAHSACCWRCDTPVPRGVRDKNISALVLQGAETFFSAWGHCALQTCGLQLA